VFFFFFVPCKHTYLTMSSLSSMLSNIQSLQNDVLSVTTLVEELQNTVQYLTSQNITMLGQITALVIELQQIKEINKSSSTPRKVVLIYIDTKSDD